ncbi:hypothetical protein CK203_104548 [Vitis vinifera]|uniref:Uncharacterized protein n=1 Tax=Vitis vinifera TaxID=29760 RepID=A0A438FGJ8_VITVI|nr:hypothetical protein CK203_104548 [Vitis vinifera]
MFNDKGMPSRQSTLRTIMSTKMIEGTPIRDHMIHMITLFNKMEILGAKIDGETQMVEGILKDHNGVHIKIKEPSRFQLKKRLNEGEMYLTLAFTTRIVVQEVGDVTLVYTLNFVPQHWHLSFGCHIHPSFTYGTTRAPFRLSRCPSLVWVCLWSIVVHMWFILEGHHGHFPSRSHHAIGRKWGHPDVLA